MRYEIVPDSWAIARAEDENGPLIVRVNQGLARIRRHADFAHELGVAIPINAPNKVGFPDPPEVAQLKAIEDALIPTLEQNQESILALVSTGGGVREYMLYTRAPDAARARVQALAAAVTTHELQCIVHHDPQWKLFEAFSPLDAELSPTDASAELPVGAFWEWFVANEHALFTFETDRERVFHRLGEAMGAVHGDLTFEFGPVMDARREFVISADGSRDAFPAVVALAAAAPRLSRWTVTPFRPRRAAPLDLRIGAVSVRADDMALLPEALEGKVGLEVLIAGYRATPESVFEQIGMLLLDHVLGEYDVETKIGYIEFGPRPAVLPPHAIALKDLPGVIDRLAVPT
jgi:hypothetical protein